MGLVSRLRRHGRIAVPALMLQNIHPIDADAIAGFLAEGNIRAVALGRAEAGTRALGHRSILACARTLAMKERINGLVKHRQAFQPLAPICLAEDLATYFELPAAEITLRYMTFALPCADAIRELAPAIVHADGTARVQVIDEHAPPLLRAILRAYRRRQPQRAGAGQDRHRGLGVVAAPDAQRPRLAERGLWRDASLRRTGGLHAVLRGR